MSAEDDRAAEYRRQQIARAQWECDNVRRLAGDPAAYRALLERTKARIPDMGWEPPVRC